MNNLPDVDVHLHMCTYRGKYCITEDATIDRTVKTTFWNDVPSGFMLMF
jgi:hypothetical protein